MAVQRKSRKKTAYHVKMQAKNVASNLFGATIIFVSILMVTVFFILYQWKSVEIRTYLAKTDQLRSEILELTSENNQLEKFKNELVRSVPAIATNKLRMINPVEKPNKLSMDLRKVQQYEEKDREIQR